MDKKKLDKLNDYYKANKNKCLALRSWINIKDKKFKLIDALECIYDAVGGKSTAMTNVIDHLCNYKKTFGRAQVYADDINLRRHVDIVPQDGKLALINYDPNAPLNIGGQKGERNPNIFRKSDGHTKRTYQQKEEILNNIGYGVRNLFPRLDVNTLQAIIKAVSDYAYEKKISYQKVLTALENGKLVFDPRLDILRPSARENKIIVINEDIFNSLQEDEDWSMSEYKFNSNIKHFLSALLSDPANAQPSLLLLKHGFTRSKLIPMLINNGLLIRREKISDKDENGELKTVTMKVRFQVPKKNFKHNLKKLYIKNFERNVPNTSYYDDDNEILMEDGEGAMGCGATGADASGAFDQPLFGLQRRKMPTSISETDSVGVGNFEYDVPTFGDKETLARKNGKFGSVSVNNV